MNYELALALKNAGFPLSTLGKPDRIIHGATQFRINDVWYFEPNLSELIEAIGEEFAYLAKADDGSEWKASNYSYERHIVDEAVGQTAEEAVARLYLRLKETAVQ